jgi:hypothetical protein
VDLAQRLYLYRTTDEVGVINEMGAISRKVSIVAADIEGDTASDAMVRAIRVVETNKTEAPPRVHVAPRFAL